MTPPRKCLYETLDVKQSATNAELKKAYRILALERHPDKNPGDREAAEEDFKELQHAYDVLSNSHERAWYDGHRNEILRGDDGASGRSSGKKENLAKRATDIDLQPYFSSSMYSGFGDSSGEFFAVFGDLFDRLSREDEGEEGSDVDVKGKRPVFGGSSSEWDSARRFYAVWESYSSRRSFAFADMWNVADVPRSFRREMERENKRERARARKEFNGVVRDLVSSVKKRDPRVAKRKREEEHARKEDQKEKERLKVEREAMRKIELEMTRAMRDEALEEDGEALDSILASIALDERLERLERRRARQRKGNADVEVEEKQLAEQEEEDNINVEVKEGEGNIQDSGGASDDVCDEHGNKGMDGLSEDSEENEVPAEELYCAACRKLLRTPGQLTDHLRSKKHKAAAAHVRQDVLKEEQLFATSESHPKGEGNANKGENGLPTHEDGLDMSSIVNGNGDPSTANNGSKRKKKKRRGKQPQQPDAADGSIQAKEAEVETSKISKDVEQEDVEQEDVEQGKDEKEGEKKLSKREKRKLREQKKREEVTKVPVTEENGENGSKFICNRCRSKFDSRSKLMRHVRDAGHALHVDEPASRHR